LVHQELTMETSFHRFTDLFAQLGLPSDPASIESFLRDHSPLPDGMQLADAPFWSASQSALLREEILEDADWAEVVDRLNVALRRAAV
jgi:Protein of unknown function (DUF2789)